jgi:hypothetical protein
MSAGAKDRNRGLSATLKYNLQNTLEESVIVSRTSAQLRVHFK